MTISHVQAADYESVWNKVYPETLEPAKVATASPIQKAFFKAASSDDLTDATAKWQQFTKKYAPKQGGYEDAVHERYQKWAMLELARCQDLAAGKMIEAIKIEQSLYDFAKTEDQ